LSMRNACMRNLRSLSEKVLQSFVPAYLSAKMSVSIFQQPTQTTKSILPNLFARHQGGCQPALQAGKSSLVDLNENREPLVACLSMATSLLKVSWLESCLPGDTRQHSRTDLLLIAESKHHIRPAVLAQRAMRSGLALDLPSDPHERGQNPRSLGCRPRAHAANKPFNSGTASP
jgi:hypothetical protein